jgi:hypothetical protein
MSTVPVEAAGAADCATAVAAFDAEAEADDWAL